MWGKLPKCVDDTRPHIFSRSILCHTEIDKLVSSAWNFVYCQKLLAKDSPPVTNFSKYISNNILESTVYWSSNLWLEPADLYALSKKTRYILHLLFFPFLKRNKKEKQQTIAPLVTQIDDWRFFFIIYFFQTFPRPFPGRVVVVSCSYCGCTLS